MLNSNLPKIDDETRVAVQVLADSRQRRKSFYRPGLACFLIVSVVFVCTLATFVTAEDSFAVQKNDQRAESENSEDDEIITLFHGL